VKADDYKYRCGVCEGIDAPGLSHNPAAPYCTEDFHPPRQKYWYLIEHHTCPICGQTTTFRERQYTPKPENQSDRVFYFEFYDYCDAFYG
jgi:hypothetical protein